MADLPKDPAMLLSIVNMKLRDFYPSLDVLCDDLEIEKDAICVPLSRIGYEYDERQNQFV